jgi:hypothetical protein
MGAQSQGCSLHRHGNDDTAQRQTQEGNYDGDNFGFPFERPNITIADCGCRDERPVKAIKA